MDLAPSALMGPLLMLLGYVGLGFIAAQRLNIDPRPIATLLVYLIALLLLVCVIAFGSRLPSSNRNIFAG